MKLGMFISVVLELYSWCIVLLQSMKLPFLSLLNVLFKIDCVRYLDSHTYLITRLLGVTLFCFFFFIILAEVSVYY